MKVIISIGFTFILLFFSCNVTKDLTGKTFKYKSKNRTLQLIFENDSICKLNNSFHCNDINMEFREITIFCKYIRDKDTLYLRNINCKDDSCNYNLTIYIPPQETQKCLFLSENKRNTYTKVGPSYMTDYQKYGLVPNIDIDTLFIIKNKILLYKYNDQMSIGYYFK